MPRKDPEARREYERTRAQDPKRKAQVNANVRAHYKKYPERSAERLRNWRRANPEKRAVQVARTPKEASAHRSMKYISRKLKAFPAWVSKEQQQQMVLLYAEARRLTELTGVQFQIDHIYPLQGKTVTGLHVPENLQILPHYENQSKGNRCL